MKTSIAQFYRKQLQNGTEQDSILTAECPFCQTKGKGEKGKIVVFLNESSLFYGYFRCLNFCVNGGFVAWFAHLLGIDPTLVPGEVDDEMLWQDFSYPQKNINSEIDDFKNKLSQEKLAYFTDALVGEQVLQLLNIGYNGRYLVYPYSQPDGNTYSARCVHPDKPEDFFWYGDESYGAGDIGLFNIEEIARCKGGALFICEGEENLLAIKQLGFPGVAYCDRKALERVPPDIFTFIKTVFIVPQNNPESYGSARIAASQIGFKVRIIKWSVDLPKEYNLRQFAIDSGGDFGKKFGRMIVGAKPFSPFTTPERENRRFLTALADQAGVEYKALLSGFNLLDSRIGGIHGLNILGGGPKVGKSCFMIQIATDMAARKIPVLYYDFENGRQRIYQRTFSRMSRIETTRLQSSKLSKNEQERHSTVAKKFGEMLRYFRVINDRKVSPEIMRRHVDFLRHETGSEYTVIVIDSLHKLPFKDLAEMRTGIDAWLRQMESIRDELNVSFLIVSELSRGEGGSYDGQPHMGVFKGSGDIEYSADNAMVLLPDWDHMQSDMARRVNKLWLVGSREHSPGLVGEYVLDYPYWGFLEEEIQSPE